MSSPGAPLDLRGSAFGNLRAIAPCGSSRLGILWECECLLCGTMVVRCAAALRWGQAHGSAQACAKCARRAGATRRAVRMDKRNREFFRRLWENTGSLYWSPPDPSEFPEATMCERQSWNPQERRSNFTLSNDEARAIRHRHMKGTRWE